MRTSTVEFDSDGVRIRGLLRLPEDASFPVRGLPVIVQGPGWLGLAAAAHYARYHEAFVARGFAVLVFDYRGFGASDGEPGWILPEAQIADIRSAIDFASAQPIIDRSRIGLFGMGGTGAGNVIVAGARDPRVRCLVTYHVVADGADWLRRMRDADGWTRFLARVAADRERRSRGEPGELVDPREELMIQTSERRASAAKRDLDGRLPARFHLASAEALLAYRPIDEAEHVARLLVATVAGDTVTPEDHALAVYARARPPKRLGA
ncbi:MAG: CocE/NonD family hydrolase, partial [Chloroflexota bacterium]